MQQNTAAAQAQQALREQQNVQQATTLPVRTRPQSQIGTGDMFGVNPAPPSMPQYPPQTPSPVVAAAAPQAPQEFTPGATRSKQLAKICLDIIFEKVEAEAILLPPIVKQRVTLLLSSPKFIHNLQNVDRIFTGLFLMGCDINKVRTLWHQVCSLHFLLVCFYF
jgi:hypothetical protein